MLENFPRRFKVHRFVTHKSGIRLSHVVGRKLFFESASFIPRDLCQFIVPVVRYQTPISKTQVSFIYFNSFLFYFFQFSYIRVFLFIVTVSKQSLEISRYNCQTRFYIVKIIIYVTNVIVIEFAQGMKKIKYFTLRSKNLFLISISKK